MSRINPGMTNRRRFPRRASADDKARPWAHLPWQRAFSLTAHEKLRLATEYSADGDERRCDDRAARTHGVAPGARATAERGPRDRRRSGRERASDHGHRCDPDRAAGG